MVDIIICSLALAMVQLWLLPMSINLKNMAWLLSSRDEPIDTSILQQRVDRAGANLQVGLVPFLALCLLSMQIDVDISATATYWLVLRVIYVPLYMAGTNVVRSVVWVASTACLIYMAMQLV